MIDLGDVRERISLHHGVERRPRGRMGDRGLLLDLGHALKIAHQKNEFLAVALGGHRSLHRRPRLGRVEAHVDRVGRETQFIQQLCGHRR